METYQTQPTKVTLISWTKDPLETIYTEWQLSRTEGPVKTIDELKSQVYEEIENEYVRGNEKASTSSPLAHKILEVAEKVIAMSMPLGEHIQLLFSLEHCPIALREQVVRHRIGHKFGERLGADTVPDLAGGSSFWSQTTRIINMGQFAEKGEYRVPDWLKENQQKPIGNHKRINPITGQAEEVSVLEAWHEAMQKIQGLYNKFIGAGMPLEDARDLLPLGMQHRFTWSTNLAAIMHVLHRRGCWLAQLGMWRPVIEGIVEELATKINPMFRRLIDPPCFDSSGDFIGCAFVKENEEVVGNGNYPPCSLWVNRQAVPARKHQYLGRDEFSADSVAEHDFVNDKQWPRYQQMQQKYAQLWKRDPKTGERVLVSA